MEGPSLVILKEELQPFIGKRVVAVAGNTRQPKESLKGRTLASVVTWGKNLFLVFASPGRDTPKIETKTHFLMFGSYRIDEPRPDRTPRLELKFRNGVVYFYSCSIRFGTELLDALDWRVDLMSEMWDPRHILDLMASRRETFLCDLLLDQKLFAGSGNIVKNEVLFNIRRHPLTRLAAVDAGDWPKLVQAVHEYCWSFYQWKKRFELRKHWQVYRQSVCPLCDTKLVREKLGKFLRQSFYCPKHQSLRPRSKKLRVYTVLPMKHAVLADGRLDH